MMARGIFNAIAGVLLLHFVLVMILMLPVIVLAHVILKQDLSA